MNNEIALTKPGNTSLSTFLSGWEQRKQVAETLIRSGFLPQAFTKPEQVLAVMLTAHELGIPEMEALRSINVIQGKPTISPQLMLALARRTGELEDVHFERTQNAVVCTIKRRGQSSFSTEFGVKEATAMGVMVKDNYKKQPFTMFQWRALAANLRVTFGDAITGLYTPEELGAEVGVTEEGDQVVVLPEQTHESVDMSTGEIVEPPPPVTVAGATFQTFDPAVETIGFGKYQGMKWVEAEVGYLQWLANSSTKADTKAKAEATLKAIEAVKSQQAEAAQEEGDAFEGRFDEPPPPVVTLRGELEKQIKAAKTVTALGGVAKHINSAAETGELTVADKEALQAIGKARLNEIQKKRMA